MNRKMVENLQYLVLVALMCGQGVTGSNFMIGQSLYLGANLISVFRCFALNRPMADKVKDISCLGLTLALMGYRIFC